MKKLFILFIFLPSILFAQQNKIKLENVVNEQFSTLLESLLIDGKIDETNAKTYLETVFGYDEGVSSYLETVNLSQQLKSIGENKMSFDGYMESLGSNLFNIIPANYKQALKDNPNYLAWQVGEELANKNLSVETLHNFLDYFANSIRKSNEDKIKNEKIIKKLEQITPRLNKLVENNNKFIKLTLSNNMSLDNWSNFPYSQSEIKEGSYVVSNKGIFENNIYEISSQVINVTGHIEWQLIKSFKNKNKFDFSKDFILELDGSFLNIQSAFTLCIGKGYYVNVLKSPSDVIITTPINYEITPLFGNIKPLTSNSKKKIYYHSETIKAYEQRGVKVLSLPKEEIEFGKTFKLIVEKKGTIFTVKINDISFVLDSDVKYFPEKYFLGFYLSDYSEKSVAKFQIKDLKLKHQ